MHIIHGSVPFENDDILSVRLSVIEERKAHFGPYISMAAALKWAAARADTSLPLSSLLL